MLTRDYVSKGLCQSGTMPMHDYVMVLCQLETMPMRDCASMDYDSDGTMLAKHYVSEGLCQ